MTETNIVNLDDKRPACEKRPERDYAVAVGIGVAAFFALATAAAGASKHLGNNDFFSGIEETLNQMPQALSHRAPQDLG